MDRRRSLLKIAALRSERERQAGVKMGYNQYVDNSESTMFKSPSMPIGTNDFTLEYFGNLYGAISSNTPLIFNANAYYAYSKGCLLIYGTSQIAVRWIIFEKPSSGDLLLDSIDLIGGAQESILHLALTRKGTTVKVYINGELKATKEQSAVKDLGDFRLGMANSSNMVMSRIYNYAMAADEVKDLYNDGDPAGYVLPNAMKELTPVEIVGNNSYTWTGETDHVYYRELLLGRFIQTGAVVMIKGSVSDYQSGEPFVYVGNRQAMIPAQNGSFTLKVINNRDNIDRIYYYGGTHLSDRRLTITIDSVALVGCVAEYLPQNLVGQWHEKPFDLSGQNSYTWTGETDTIYSRSVLLGRTCKSGTAVSVKGTVSDYQSGAPFIYAGRRRVDIPAKDGDFTVMVTGLDAFDRVSYYGGLNGSDRRLTITIDSVDLIPDVALAWLDSARQLPLNDEYLPPLLQSDGGYDLTASGMPEIIIK